MRRVWMGGFILMGMAGLAWSQAMVEAAGAIAGGSVGGVAGKKVSDGITLCLKAEPRFALPIGRNAEIADPFSSCHCPCSKSIFVS